MSSSQLSQRYQIPTHLNVSDTFSITLLGITMSVTTRQGLIFLLGWSTAFNLWRHLDFLGMAGIGGTIIRLLIPSLLALATFVFATIQVAGRHPEHWMIVLLHYALLPKMYCWKRLDSEPRSEQHRQSSSVPSLEGGSANAAYSFSR